MIAALLLIIFSAAMVYVIIHSLLYMTVPNIILAVLLGSFLLLYPWIEVGTSTYFYHIAAFIIFLIAGFLVCLSGAMQGGAAKLIAVIALYMGMTKSAFEFVVLFCVSGGVLALIVSFKDKNKPVNYSVGVGLAGLIAYPGTYLGKMGVGYLSALIGVS